MSILSMLERYRVSGKPSAQEKPFLERMISNERHNAQAAQAPGLCHGYFRIEKVIPADPVRLFGNAALSRAHNRISIHAEPGGPALFSALISDPALSALIMNTNTSDSQAEATLERVAGKLISGDIPADRDPEEVIGKYAADIREKEVDAARAFAERVADLKRPPGKEETAKLISAATGGFVFREQSFYLKQYQDAAFARAATLRGEAANLIRNAHLLPTPDAPAEDEAVPLSSVVEAERLLGESAAERMVLARAHAHEMMLMADKLGLENYDPRKDVNGSVLTSAMGYQAKGDEREVAKDHARALSYLLSGREPAERDPRHLIGHLTHTYGNTRIHSDSGADNDRHITLSFSAATADESFGQRRVRDALHVPFVSIAVGAVDFMSALRGDAAGEVWSRCSIEQMYGRRVPQVPFTHPLDLTHDEAERKVSLGVIPEVKAQQDAGRALADHIRATGLRTAGERAEAVRMAKALANGAGPANDALFRASGETLRGITEHIEEDVREKFAVMMRGRDAQALTKSGQDIFGLLAGPGE